MKKSQLLLVALILSLLSVGFRLEVPLENSREATDMVMVVSVSSDGRYAVSSHRSNRLVLWDIESRKKRIISEMANIYSAYFVKGGDFFIWQDLDDVVYVQKIDGKIVKSFTHFPTYGHVLSSDLDKYLTSDSSYNIYLGYGKNLKPIKKDGNRPSFLGTGKLLNLSLSNDGSYLLSAGTGFDIADNLTISDGSPIQPEQRYSNYAGVVLWDLSSGKPLCKFSGHAGKTTATLSPDGQYVVSGSENGVGRVHTRKGTEKFLLASLFHGLRTQDTGEDPEKWYDNTGLIPTPDDLNSNSAILAIRFIGTEHYLRFLTYSPYAVLYHIDNPLPLKYLYLGRDPLPAVNDYSRNAAMDTAPESGILVMGQDNGSGIIVYRYDPEKQALNKIWVADAAE